MATYHKDLEYSEDTIQKHSITENELTFLRNLQKELNTQDTLGQANPRYWIIKGEERIYHVLSDEADGMELYNSETYETVSDNIAEIKEYIENEILPEVNKIDGLNRRIILNKNIKNQENIVILYKDSYYDDVHQRALEDIEDIEEWLEDVGFSEYKVISYKTVDKFYHDSIFLTQKAAEEHLKMNSHHYDAKAHTYGMTAWRSPDFEKLIKILQEVQW